MKIVSFDVFDTLITRRCATPQGIFWLMQEKLQKSSLPKLFCKNFCILRSEIEQFLKHHFYAMRIKREVNLEDIYQSFKENYFLTDDDVKFCIQLELDTEKENIVPLTGNIQRLKDFQADNCVILISDMYLKPEEIRYLLVDIDKIFADIPIYSSAQSGSTKYSGQLYRAIKRERKITDWIHIGDNIDSDIKMANSLGIKTIFIHSATLTSSERQMLRLNPDAQLFFGAVKNARHFCQSKISQTAVSFAAPLLFCYVSYIVKTALDRGIEHLYFISRDGYVLKMIADEIIYFNKYSINSHYIYGSRLAWQISIQREELFDFENKKALLIKYLQQEIDFSEQNFAFVDIIGTGKTVDMLADIIRSFAPASTLPVFYCSASSAMRSTEISPKYVYFCTNKYKGQFLEIIVRAPHGQVMGYKEDSDSGNVVPILSVFECDKLWFQEYFNGIKAFTKEILKSEHMAQRSLSSIELFCQYCDHFRSHIDKEAADVFGSIIHSPIGLETTQCAPELNFLSLMRHVTKKEKLNQHLLFISEARSTKYWNCIFNIYLKFEQRMAMSVTNKSTNKKLPKWFGKIICCFREKYVKF